MKNTLLALTAAALLLAACASEQPAPSYTEINKIYNPDSLPRQTFSIDAGKDTVLKGSQGTLLRIDKNTFVDAAGNAITGKIAVELKEALTPIDMVLGNLTTTSNGQALQTGGMVYVNASANGSPVFIGTDKSIGVAVPTDSVKQGMSIYEGVPVGPNGAEGHSGHGEGHGSAKDTLATLNWQNPVPLAQQQPAAATAAINVVKITSDIYLNPTNKGCNFAYYVDGYYNPPQVVVDYFEELCTKGKGLKIKNDTIVTVSNYQVNLINNKNVKAFENGEPTAQQSAIYDTLGAINWGVVDNNSSYIFEIKKLGWANIDKLYHNPAAVPCNLIVNVEGWKNFGFVYTTMLADQAYIAGYQKQDKSYSFGFYDGDQTVMPVGMPATIIATAYKGDKAYLAIQKITIAKTQTVNLKMDETTVEGLKKTLKEKI